MSPEDILLLQKLHTNCKAELYATIKINEELTAEIERLTRPQTVVARPGIDEKTFKIDNRVFGFRMPAIIYKGQKISPFEVMADESLQHELVRIKSGFIYEKN